MSLPEYCIHLVVSLYSLIPLFVASFSNQCGERVYRDLPQEPIAPSASYDGPHRSH
jgi:hypothetical protein